MIIISHRHHRIQQYPLSSTAPGHGVDLQHQAQRRILSNSPLEEIARSWVTGRGQWGKRDLAGWRINTTHCTVNAHSRRMIVISNWIGCDRSMWSQQSSHPSNKILICPAIQVGERQSLVVLLMSATIYYYHSTIPSYSMTKPSSVRLFCM